MSLITAVTVIADNPSVLLWIVPAVLFVNAARTMREATRRIR
jgi:hypothetical protein